jgi:putative ABC transport system substrate-binding protein
MTSRRTFVAGTITVLAGSLAAEAQQPGRLPRVGVLLIASPEHHPIARAQLAEFRQGLRERGYVESQTIVIEPRFASDKVQRHQDFVAEFVRLKVDVIVVTSTPMALAAKEVTTTVPIVAVVMADPVKDGVVATLARPGGNITGLTFLGPALVAKRLQLLRDTVPGATHVAVLSHPGVYSEQTMRDMVDEAQAAAKTLGMRLQFFEARSPNDFEKAFSAMAAGGINALTVFPSPMFYAEHRRLVDLAMTHRLPVIYAFREAADAGGLMAYGPNIPGLFRFAATLVDKILKGARPAELPVEQPTKFELVINLKAAKALRLTIPSSLLLRADEVLE